MNDQLDSGRGVRTYRDLRPTFADRQMWTTVSRDLEILLVPFLEHTAAAVDVRP
jgi:hypothetical protein